MAAVCLPGRVGAADRDGTVGVASRSVDGAGGAVRSKGLLHWNSMLV